LALGARVAADHLRRIFLILVLAVERDLNLRRALHDVIVGQDEARLVDDEAGARGLHDLVARTLALLLPLAASALAEEALEQIILIAAAAAAAEEVAQVLRPLPRPGADVGDGRRGGIWDGGAAGRRGRAAAARRAL